MEVGTVGGIAPVSDGLAMSTKATNGSGSLERRGATWWARVSFPDGSRRRVPIADSEKMTEAQARKAGAKLAADIRAGRIVFDGRPGRAAATATTTTTVRQVAEAWLSGELLETHGAVNRLRPRTKGNARVELWRLSRHAFPVKTRGPSAPCFGDLPMHDVTEEDCTRVMAAFPADLRSGSRLQVYMQLHRLFDLGIMPCRLRKEGDNPVTRYLRPSPDANKLFCFLYPSELLSLLHGGTDAEGRAVVPLVRRVFYAVATYTGQRKGSLFALRWKHVDFDHGTLASFKTKTGRAQYFVADPGLMTVLKAWKALRGNPSDDDALVTLPELGYPINEMAVALRTDLKAVGVTRALLFEDEAPNVEPLRFHDLRSTFCTWARRAGKSDAWISERTGHDLDGNMISRYDRGATTLEDLAYAPFPDISRAIPELADEPRLATRLATSGGGDSAKSRESLGDRRGSNPRHLEPQSSALPAELRPPRQTSDAGYSHPPHFQVCPRTRTDAGALGGPPSSSAIDEGELRGPPSSSPYPLLELPLIGVCRFLAKRPNRPYRRGGQVRLLPRSHDE